MFEELPELTAEERAIYEWQMWLPGFGESAQRKLKRASVLISRVGGLGGLVAYQLAAAGVGKLILAHGGILRPGDLNRQLLQTHDHLGKPRIENIVRRLRELNPRVEIVGVGENVSNANAVELVNQADVVVDAAPLFEERFALNHAAVALNRPMVECAMYAMEAHITTFIPGITGCLACLCPEKPTTWRRQFPVLGAVSGTVACIGAVEVVKVLTGLGTPLAGTLLAMDLGTMEFRRLKTQANPDCAVCGVTTKIPAYPCHADECLAGTG
jgi:molybdopterin/thiamine biosynthesis adenylyltransferase